MTDVCVLSHADDLDKRGRISLILATICIAPTRWNRTSKSAVGMVCSSLITKNALFICFEALVARQQRAWPLPRDGRSVLTVFVRTATLSFCYIATKVAEKCQR